MPDRSGLPVFGGVDYAEYALDFCCVGYCGDGHSCRLTPSDCKAVSFNNTLRGDPDWAKVLLPELTHIVAAYLPGPIYEHGGDRFNYTILLFERRSELKHDVIAGWSTWELAAIVCAEKFS